MSEVIEGLAYYVFLHFVYTFTKMVCFVLIIPDTFVYPGPQLIMGYCITSYMVRRLVT